MHTMENTDVNGSVGSVHRMEANTKRYVGKVLCKFPGTSCANDALTVAGQAGRNR